MRSSHTLANRPSPLTFFKMSGRLICLRAVLGLALLAGVVGPVQLRAQSAVQREYAIKAAYLQNFINYIEWPADALPPVGGTITIGIVGENPFGLVTDPQTGKLIDPLNGKHVKGRTLAVRQVATPSDLEQCQVVFVCTSEKARLAEIVGQLKSARALTVSEVDGFAAQGGIINFISERNKVRFEINPEAARRIGLTISSELLKLAKLVKS